MKTKGVRISDIKDGKCIALSEILENFKNGDQLNWSILWMDVTPLSDQGKYIMDLQKKINNSENGLIVSFYFLVEIAAKIYQEIDVTIIACKEYESLCRYNKDQEMYETCDIVIEMIDGGFWEIFSKDVNFIDQLEKKFKETEFLTSDFQEWI